jgi:hypothetical protein
MTEDEWNVLVKETLFLLKNRTKTPDEVLDVIHGMYYQIWLLINRTKYPVTIDQFCIDMAEELKSLHGNQSKETVQ